MDTILSGTVPIFTHPEQYDILPSWIDWSQLSYFVTMTSSTTNKGEFLKSLDDILKDDKGYRQRHQAVLQHRSLFDWTTLYPFDAYMFMLQKDVYPETILFKRNKSLPGSHCRHIITFSMMTTQLPK